MMTFKAEAEAQDAEIEHVTKHLGTGSARNFDGGMDTNVLQTLSIIFGSGGLALAYLAALKPLIVEWLKNRNGRTMRIKKGEVEIELKGLQDFEEAITVLKRLDD
ncbi:effector-associated constant component EACC1 [Pontibacter sp. G13]|uniref:effector-associated constant component EACC1 n=1 Tax=Pontibacter sp. G13 TaxID=3074898 RepID=UPI00288B5810|nr:hypothetical protein [Pontibacter sp. G13]WNJ17863.1 hypothetical protein RJD25_23670 [Pontibacter sp. G13]